MKQLFYFSITIFICSFSMAQEDSLSMEDFDFGLEEEENDDVKTRVKIGRKKLAFEDRARFYADPDYVNIDLDYLLSDDYGAKRAELIDVNKAALEVDHGDPKLIEGDTIYLTVADKDGMMVSLIQSNYRGMGSGMAPPKLSGLFLTQIPILGLKKLLRNDSELKQ